MAETAWFIDILDTEKNYRGIQRKQSTISNLGSKLINEYIDIFSDEVITFSKQTANRLLTLSQIANSINLRICTEVVVFGVGKFDIKNNSAEFLGFDITGDSYYISPIKLMYFDEYNINVTDNNKFFSLLNENGLFKTEKDASDYIIEIEKYSIQEFEKDNNLKPIKVYLLKSVV